MLLKPWQEWNNGSFLLRMGNPNRLASFHDTLKRQYSVWRDQTWWQRIASVSRARLWISNEPRFHLIDRGLLLILRLFVFFVLAFTVRFKQNRKRSYNNPSTPLPAPQRQNQLYSCSPVDQLKTCFGEIISWHLLQLNRCLCGFCL